MRITDWASAEIKHSGNELRFTNLLDRNKIFERTETRLFSAACPGYKELTKIVYFNKINFFD